MITYVTLTAVTGNGTSYVIQERSTQDAGRYLARLLAGGFVPDVDGGVTIDRDRVAFCNVGASTA